jgi:hypothetical protein
MRERREGAVEISLVSFVLAAAVCAGGMVWSEVSASSAAVEPVGDGSGRGKARTKDVEEIRRSFGSGKYSKKEAMYFDESGRAREGAGRRPAGDGRDSNEGSGWQGSGTIRYRPGLGSGRGEGRGGGRGRGGGGGMQRRRRRRRGFGGGGRRRRNRRGRNRRGRR